jgi:hypothetical protein
MFVEQALAANTPEAKESLESLSFDELEAELSAQAAHVDAGLARLLELVGECERRPEWQASGNTFAAWLAWRCSLLPRQAREHERIGVRLAELPQIRAAFASGRLSYAKASALTRIAEPECEQKLLELAEVLTASQLERAVGAYRQLTREQAAETQARAFLHWFWAEDGSLSLRGRLPAEEGALLLRALEAGRQALRERRRADVSDETQAADEAREAVEAAPPEPCPEECRVSNAEALVAIADLALARRDGDRTGGERYQVVVHVDAPALAADGDGDGRCELEDGRPLAAETARRLSCDGSLFELHKHDGETLSLGRKRRTVSPPLRRALVARDRGCRFPGCESTRFVDAHHLRHWIHGGETNLDNLVLLCSRHHRLVHELGYKVSLVADGEVRFANQHGIVVPSVPRPPPCSHRNALRNRNRSRSLDIGAATTWSGSGERVPLADATDAILAIHA